MANLKTMRDSITVADLNLMVENGDPVPDAFGGYDDGRYADAAAISAAYPSVPVLKFTVFSADNEGDCLDIENGDATPDAAPGWTVRRRQAGHTWVTNYCSESDYNAVVAAHNAQGVPCPWLILAGYPGSVGDGVVYPWPFVVGHQFADRGPYDESVLLPTYPLFPQPIPPLPPLPEGVTMADLIANAAWTQFAYTDKNGHLQTFFVDPKTPTGPAHWVNFDITAATGATPAAA